MKLSECRIGTVVIEINPHGWHKGKEFRRIGHITGLMLNACEAVEVIPVVQWAHQSAAIDLRTLQMIDNRPQGVHPTNLELYVD